MIRFDRAERRLYLADRHVHHFWLGLALACYPPLRWWGLGLALSDKPDWRDWWPALQAPVRHGNTRRNRAKPR